MAKAPQKSKKIVWLGSSKEMLSGFPMEAKLDAGYQLWQVQQGSDPSDFKSMPDVGAGVAEIRIDIGDAYRVFYVAKFEEAVYVLHAFSKKTRKTSKRDLDRGRSAYSALLELRAKNRKKVK